MELSMCCERCKLQRSGSIWSLNPHTMDRNTSTATRLINNVTRDPLPTAQKQSIFKGSILSLLSRRYITLVVLTMLWQGINASPTRTDNKLSRTARHVSGADYLSTFGYLPMSDMETGALRSEKDLQGAIRKFQSYAHLPITGILDEATKTKMQSPRCGMPDRVNYDKTPQGYRTKRYVPGPSKWQNTDLTYRIRNYTPDLESAKIRDAIERAFKVWSAVTPMTFREVFYEKSDMEIIFASGYHEDGYRFDGPGLILAHAFFPGEERGGDVHFDEDEFWTWGTEEGTNLFMVAAHEIGHALGLSHSNVAGSLMYPWYQGYMPDFQLHYDDISGIQYLYGGSSSPRITPRPTPRPTTLAPRTRPPVRPPTRSPAGPTYKPVVPSAGPDKGYPDPCNTGLDAISIIRLEIFAFKGKWFWRIDKETGKVTTPEPLLIHEFWYGFPSNLTHIDAVYERPGDNNIVFFSGARYWLFNANHRIQNFPVEGRPIYEFGFPHDIQKVDAAFVWGYNDRTYLISKDMYWRYNEKDSHMDSGYPRDVSMWAGIGTPVDTVFQYFDKTTYFFSGLQYWKFNDARMHAHTTGYPRPVGQKIGCAGHTTEKITAERDHSSSVNVNLLSLATICIAGFFLS